MHTILVFIKDIISLTGILIILSGALQAIYQYCKYLLQFRTSKSALNINMIRLNMGRILVLGLEFIVAADLIGTTTTPDYYTLGIVASIVAIRTILSFTLNREIMGLSKEELRK